MLQLVYFTIDTGKFLFTYIHYFAHFMHLVSFIDSFGTYIVDLPLQYKEMEAHIGSSDKLLIFWNAKTTETVDITQ